MDYNLYLLHFFAPRQCRQSILSVMASHCELRAIPKKVQDPTLMMIRLQWWRDEIEKMQSDQPFASSPILEGLSKINKTLAFEDYLERFETSFRGEDCDIEEALYHIFGQIIDNEKANNRFSKILSHHDTMGETTRFRALRLWLGI